MGCNVSRKVAIEELQDIADILKLDNTKLEEEKEKLLYDQIDKPSDDKEIAKCLKNMNGELEEQYVQSRQLLFEFVETISRQKENTPENRIFQIIDLRQQIEEVYRRTESFCQQKKAQIRLCRELAVAIEDIEKEIIDKTQRLSKLKSLCVKPK